MSITRRQALKSVFGGGAAFAASQALPSEVKAARDVKVRDDAVGMLYDTSKCTGCKACVTACTAANNLIPDTRLSHGLWQMPQALNARTKNIIKLHKDESTYSFVKQQCMHCVDPTCVAGCPFFALDKKEFGIVTWDGSRCIGCRFCEVVCPYEIPKFEWDEFNPRIVKCEMCDHRLDEYGVTACCGVCPTGAVIYGKHSELMDVAKKRILENPGKYHENRVFGEWDGGGTQVLYLSHVSFQDIGLPDLGRDSLPNYGATIREVTYKWMLLPTAVLVFFATIIKKRWEEHDREAMQAEEETGLKEQL